LKTLAIALHQLKQWLDGHLSFLTPRRRGGLHHLLLAVVWVALALMVRFAMAPVDAGLQYVTFFPAVTLAAVAGGFRPGLLATLLGAFLATYFFTPPYYSISMDVLQRALGGNLVFLMDGLVVSIAIEAMHRYRMQLAEDLEKSIDSKSALEDSTQHLKHILDNQFAYVALLDIYGVILEFNQAVWDRFGYRREEVINHYFYDLPCWSYNETVQAQLKAAMDAALQGQTVRYDVTVKIDDDFVVIDFQISPVRNQEGRIDGLLPMAVDISSRIKAEESLKKSQAQLKTFIAQAPLAIAMFDRHMNYLETSGQWLHDFGRGYANLAGRNHYQVHPDLPEKWKQVHQQCLSGTQLRNDEDLWILADGSQCWSRWAVMPWLDEHGAIGGLIISSEDISERKRNERLLLESQKENALLADLIRTSEQPLAVGHLDGRLGLANAAFEALTGYSVEELQGINWATVLTPPEWLEIEREKLSELLQTGQPVRYEKEYIRKSGTRVPVEVLAHLKTDVEGKPEFYYGFVTDITARKQAEQALRESQIDLNRAQAVAHIGSWRMDVRSNTLEWSAENYRIFGAPQGTPQTYESFLAIVHPDDREMVDTAWKEALNGKPYDISHRIFSDGKIKWVREQAELEFNENGALLGGFGTTEDITRIKNVQDALQHERIFLRQVINATPSIIFVKDQEGRYLLGNEAVAKCYGTSLENLIGLTDSSFNPNADEVAHFRQEDLDVINACEPKHIPEQKVTHADGSVHWYSTVKIPLIEDGHCDKLLGVATDITDRKQNEAHLAEHARQLQETDRRKDEFLAMLAHELRNPLAPISNAVEILKFTDLEPAQIARCIDMINRQVKHLARLVDDLLDVSRISRGLVELKKEPLEIRDFILLAVETCQPLIDTRRHTFSLALPPEPMWVEGDRVRLAQVVSNLLNNAAKYTEEDGHIELSVEASDHEVDIHVSDNGSGIDPSDLSHLFDLFYQADRNLDRAQGGLGIGLSLVHNLVAKHGGKVQAFSAGRGQGSEFVIRLPRLILFSSTPPITATPVASGANTLHILVVDDNRDIAESLALLLESEGHQVLTAFDGISALEISHTERPDIILMDIGLPGLDGYAVAQALRQSHELDRTLLIALTGYGQPDDRKKSSASGFDEHLVKPVDIELLRKLLASYPTTRFHGSLLSTG
jgi:PAS domain S-box-containing protein